MRIPPILITFFSGTAVIWIGFAACLLALIVCQIRDPHHLHKTLKGTLIVIAVIGIVAGFYNLYRADKLPNIKFPKPVYATVLDTPPWLKTGVCIDSLITTNSEGVNYEGK